MVKKFFKNNHRGQVWIETVIYLLIAFVMIGLVLSFVRPKIEESRDKGIIEQSIQMMNEIDNIILTIGSPGNQRLIEAGIKKGSFIVDGENDTLQFKIQSTFVYSEPDEVIQIGKVLVKTEEQTRYNLITLVSNYSQIYNITYKEKDEVKTFNSASTFYRLLISNEGIDSDSETIINFDLA